jgi:putative hemolysin
LKDPLDFLGGAAEPVAILLVTLVLAYVTLVFGELAPKRIAMQRAERWGLLAARPLSAMSTFTRPAVWLLSRSTDVVVRVLGADPRRQREEVTEEELRDMVATQTRFSAQQRRIIDGAFEIAQRTLREVLRPRTEVFVLDAEQPAHDGLRALVESGHSRAPVAPGGDLDATVGFVHLRDLVEVDERRIGDLVSELPVFPETARVLDVLHELQVRHVQLVVVVDEHGSAAGIVSVENLVEEIVGEIYDETDRDVLGVRLQPDGSLLVSGGFPVHDLEDIGVLGVPEGRYATVAGLMLHRLGRLPEAPGDRVQVAGRSFEVMRVTGRAITSVRIGPRDDDLARTSDAEVRDPGANPEQ